MFKYLLALLFFSMRATSVYASEVYSTAHSIEYFFNDDLSTTVTHTIDLDLKNKTTGISELKVLEPVNELEELKVVIGKGVNATFLDNTVLLTFNPVIIGPRNVSITYTYVTSNLFKKVGATYKLDIPKIEEDETVTKFDVKIYLPKNISAENLGLIEQKDEKGSYVLLGINELNKAGNSIVLGSKMFYEVKVKNIVSKSKPYLITIPTIPGRQKVYVKSISKIPDKVYRDIDENIFFEYTGVTKPLYIDIHYLVEVYGNNSTYNGSQKFTEALLYWDYTKGLPNYYLANYATKQDTIDKVSHAYDFVLNYLSYNENELANFNSIKRIGAEKINEENKNLAVCLEYSDLLIAILRGQGISAREINGITSLSESVNNKLQLHSWVEYLNDNNEWVQIDPTWGDTSGQNYVTAFDYYHINFLRRGANSSYPLLAGSYSYENNKETISLTNLDNIDGYIPVTVYYNNLGPIYFYKNTSPNQLWLKDTVLLPYSFIISFNNLTQSSDILTKLTFEKNSYFKIFPSSYIFIFLFFILSPALFFLIHIKLQNIKKRINRSKVRSIV